MDEDTLTYGLWQCVEGSQYFFFRTNNVYQRIIQDIHKIVFVSSLWVGT